MSVLIYAWSRVKSFCTWIVEYQLSIYILVFSEKLSRNSYFNVRIRALLILWYALIPSLNQRRKVQTSNLSKTSATSISYILGYLFECSTIQCIHIKCLSRTQFYSLRKTLISCITYIHRLLTISAMDYGNNNCVMAFT